MELKKELYDIHDTMNQLDLKDEVEIKIYLELSDRFDIVLKKILKV